MANKSVSQHQHQNMDGQTETPQIATSAETGEDETDPTVNQGFAADLETAETMTNNGEDAAATESAAEAWTAVLEADPRTETSTAGETKLAAAMKTSAKTIARTTTEQRIATKANERTQPEAQDLTLPMYPRRQPHHLTAAGEDVGEEIPSNHSLHGIGHGNGMRAGKVRGCK